MSGWGEFAIAFLAFYGCHMIPARPALRNRLAATLGERGYLVIFSLLSIGLLAWLIIAAAQAPYVALWDRALWQNAVPQIVMLPACLLAAFGMGVKGGLSLGSRTNSPFDRAEPGIAGITRHPLLWALALWSLSHLVPNGDFAHVILFGSFAVSAFLGMAAFDRRTRRRVGEADWQAVRRVTAHVPFASGFRWRGVDRPGLRGLIGVGLYLLLLLLHEPVIGLSPI